MAKRKASTVKMPDNGAWRDAFKTYNVRVGLNLQLSRAMLELLCAASDGVQWDRSSFGGLHCPDNWIATERSLEKRGLIECRRGTSEFSEDYSRVVNLKMASCVRLTPAGKCVVELLKSVGLFIEADAAEERRQILKKA